MRLRPYGAPHMLMNGLQRINVRRRQDARAASDFDEESGGLQRKR